MARAFTAGAGSDAEKIDLASPINLATTRTVSAWVFVNSANTTSRDIYINGRNEAAGGSQFNAILQTTGGATNEMTWGHGHGGGFSLLAWTTGWAAGTWHFIAATYDGTTLLIFAGEDVGSITQVASSTPSTTPSTPSVDIIMRVGNHPLTAQNESWDGRIANLAVYSGAALSLGALKQLSSGRIPGEGRSSLVAHLQLFGSSTEPDLSGSGRNGTVTGATVGDHVPLGPPFGFDEFVSVSVAAEDLSHVAALADSFDNVVQRRPIKVTSF